MNLAVWSYLSPTYKRPFVRDNIIINRPASRAQDEMLIQEITRSTSWVCPAGNSEEPVSFIRSIMLRGNTIVNSKTYIAK
jgi:hypothetical protein